MKLAGKLIPNNLRLNPRLIAATALVTTSLVAALVISASANRFVYVWAARSTLAIGSTISELDIERMRVFLPENSQSYFSTKANLIGFTVTRNINPHELIPASSVTEDKTDIFRKSVPIKVSRGDFPSDLAQGNFIDIYSLPIREIGNTGVAKLIAIKSYVSKVDTTSRDIGGDVGIVIKLDANLIEKFLTQTINSKLVLVRSAI